jgi:hypothetical protein
MCAKAAKGQALPWPTLRGLLEHALYGGRLDNDNDVRVLQTYLQQVRFYVLSLLSCHC